MAEKDNFDKIIKNFLENASSGELEALQKMMIDNEKKTNSGIDLNPEKFAKEISSKIKKQVGFTTENIKKTAVGLVISIAKKHQPNITDDQLEYIIEKMVPGYSQKAPIPKALLLTMIEQFVSYAIGKMDQKTINEMPQGWEKKYWENFPEIIQKIIASYIRNEINDTEFWQTIREIFNKKL